MSRKESLQHTFPWSTLGGSYHNVESWGAFAYVPLERLWGLQSL